MRGYVRNTLAILCVACLGLALFFLCGGSLDGILYGHWPPVNDHPTSAQ